MGTPSWLYYLFGLLMLAIAAYGLVLLVYSVTGRHHWGRDVDIAHLAMGVSMAGMFVTKWAFGPSAVWELIFAALLIWFMVRSIQSIQHFGLHKPHQAIHAAMSFAMLLMYWYPMGSTSGATGMSMSAASGAAKLDPGLGFAVGIGFLCFGYLHACFSHQGRLASRISRPCVRHEWGGWSDRTAGLFWE